MSREKPTHKFGWLPDVPDIRDLTYAAPRKLLTKLPTLVDHRPAMPACFDQGPLGSCTAQAIAAAHLHQQTKQRSSFFMPSRLAIYYGEREMMGTVKTDSGAFLRDGFKVIAKQGAGTEALHPHDLGKFTRKPTAKYYEHAALHQALKYERVPQFPGNMIAALAEGTCICIGFMVYESLDSRVAFDGIVNLPAQGERALGGHAVLIVGYTRDLTAVHSRGKKLKLPKAAKSVKDWFIVRNSWGANWGDKGHCYFPAEYLTNPNLAADLWRLQLLEG